MSYRVRVTATLLAAAGFGVLIALFKGQGGGVRDGIGNLSAPWLCVALLCGYRSTKRAVGAAWGLVGTLLALVGFYCVVAVTSDYGSQVGLVRDFQLAFGGNLRYLLAGLVSGPVLGLIGAWWRVARPFPVSVFAGLLFVGEVATVIVVASFRSVDRWLGGWDAAPAPYLIELVLGLILMAIAWRPRRPSSIASSS